MTRRNGFEKSTTKQPATGFSHRSMATTGVVAVTAPVHPILPPALLAGGSCYRGKTMGTDACDLVIANLSAYLDDELNNAQQQDVLNHVANCAGCAEILGMMQENDTRILREWCDCAPLPSSLAFEHAVDAIMEALPEEPVRRPAFQPKRVHVRTRWSRFAAGALGSAILLILSGISYAIGYADGRRSLASSSPAAFTAPTQPGMPALSTATSPTRTAPTSNVSPPSSDLTAAVWRSSPSATSARSESRP